MAMKRTIDFHLNDQRKKTNLFRAVRNDLDKDSSTDDEPMNLTTKIYPLSHYANDPEQLIQQLFSVVRGKRLARLIPPELKDMSFEELKADCLIQLLCMSKKRVLATLEGKDMSSSSDSDDSIDNHRKQILESENKDEISHKRSRKEKKIKFSKKKKVETESEPEKEKPEEKEGKTLLEILELEMKAKAIRALLGSNKNDCNTQIEEAIKDEIIAAKTEENNEDKTWSERYEQRQDVKEVVKTSRLCTNMRRRMLLHQQKMLAERAKLKAMETENVKPEDTIKSKLEEKIQNVYLKNDKEPTTNHNIEKNLNEITEKSQVDSQTIDDENIDDKLQPIKKLPESDIFAKTKNTTGLNKGATTINAHESTDDDSQKSTDFEKVLSDYTQKNTDLETTINEYSLKNNDLEDEINKCSKRNDDMENTMNICAQKNSDIESAIKNFSIKNNGIDENLARDSKKNNDLNNAIDEYSKQTTDLDSMIGSYSIKNGVLNAIVKEYSKRNSDILSLMGEYSQNNVDIQSVIGDYAEGNIKLETIIDEYSLRNAKIKTMIDEYSVNNSNVEKIIDRNNRKQLLINNYKMESAAGKSDDALNNTKEKIGSAVILSESNILQNVESVKDLTQVDETVNEIDKNIIEN
ncbi:origin recognition complex subunit 1 isoform X2 [Sipha flava]|uniref:Conserved anti-apoptotic protein n=1 Tax=Sipha flava TaxID=143950 RepID=A0A2S2R0W8_9HEMI|nr:origin recognition complex subunit 1 isoform X2 [Sipha flava]